MKLLFDHKLLSRRLAAPGRAPPPFADDLGPEIELRLYPVRRDFPSAALFFPPNLSLVQSLRKSKKIGTLFVAESTQPGLSEARCLSPFELISFAYQSLDLIVSCLGLQFANDLPGVLAQMRRALKPGGLLLGCLVGGDSLFELREAFALAEIEVAGGVTPRIHPSIELKQMGALLQRAEFADPIVDIEKYELLYDTPQKLLNDLRGWGLGNLLVERSRRFMPRRLLTRVMEIYAGKFSQKNGKVSARFDLIWFSGWAPSAADPAA